MDQASKNELGKQLEPRALQPASSPWDHRVACGWTGAQE